jgi:hypothetical protein
LGNKLGDGPSQMALAEWNQPIETFLFDGTDEAFNSAGDRRFKSLGTEATEVAKVACRGRDQRIHGRA